eukprot:343940-Chlamydomonas_euryale.AAC.12
MSTWPGQMGRSQRLKKATAAHTHTTACCRVQLVACRRKQHTRTPAAYLLPRQEPAAAVTSRSHHVRKRDRTSHQLPHLCLSHDKSHGFHMHIRWNNDAPLSGRP